ncbi:MAG TPA: toll/interleukin-1 receptor domain-containing protein, partial [Thauera sp.]|nr:toll/interleukin-1 receptor domain-containing protein [Thauera sp.]
LTLAGADGRPRIDDTEDMVRLEVEMALARGQNVVPLLVQGARMPSAAQLPAPLAPLAYRNALPVRPDPDFRGDVLRLVEALRA